MAKRKNNKPEVTGNEVTQNAPPAETPFNHPDAIFPNGAHFGIIQLEIDLYPKPVAQRIVQWVNRNGPLQCYVTENAYQRTELITWFDKLMRLSYQQSISKGSGFLTPIKGRIHWCRFTENFAKGKKGERINPETDEPETETPII